MNGFGGQVRSTALQALSNPKCAKALGAKSPQAAESLLNSTNITYQNLGAFVVKDMGSALQLVSNSPYAETSGSSIIINTNLSVTAPDTTLATIAGTDKTTFWPAAQQMALQVGAPSLSADQFDALMILHEVEHLLGAPQESPQNSQAYNTNIWDNCLKGLQ